MQRFAIKDYGAPKEVFTTIEAEPREVTSGHVRVALQAFGINPYDVGLRQGKMKAFRTLKFPYVPGNDGVGTVTEIAADVENVKVGDEVIVHAVGGTYGEEIVVPNHKVMKKLASMDWALAASLPTIGITAYHLLFSLLKIQPGQTVLIQGASGGVGSVAVQLARRAGVQVLATASSRNESLVKSLGVTDFAAYDQEDVGKKFEEQADIVIDATKGSRSFNTGMRALKTGGIYVALNDLPAEGERTKPGTYLHYGPKKEYSDAEALSALVAAFEANDLKIEIAEILPFELASVIEAHERMEGHPPAGKLIIKKF